jgi:signal transduction histidine kinase
VTGLIVLHAAIASLGVIVLRTALVPFVFPSNPSGHRLRAALLWAAAGLVVVAWGVRQADTPAVPSTLAVLFIAAAGWSVGAYRAALRHASQGVRLAAFFLAIAVPSVIFYPSVVDAAGRAQRFEVETRSATEVLSQRRDLQLRLNSALGQIDRVSTLPDLVRKAEPNQEGPPPTDAAFLVWSGTILATQRLTSNVELYDAAGDLVSRFALKLPDIATAQVWTEASCEWEIFEEVSPFFAEERRLLHAGKAICIPGPTGETRRVGSIVVHVMLVDYSNLPFISAQSPYVAMLRSGQPEPEAALRQPAGFAVYGWSRAALYTSVRTAWPLTDSIFSRAYVTREPFWAEMPQGDVLADVYVLNDRSAIYVLSLPRSTGVGHLVRLAELVTLVFVTFVVIVAGGVVFGLIAGRTPTTGRALLQEVRASFSRKLFLAFVAASIVPVLALALVTRAYIAALMRADIELEATRTAGVASRVAEDFSSLQSRGLAALPVVDDNVVVWLSRVIAEDVNIFAGANLLASSERNLFASGLLPTRTPGDVYRAILLEGRPSYVARETAGGFEYLVSAAPIRIQGQTAILTVPLTSRQQEVTGQIAELDRRVLLAALLLIMLGGGIGYSMAERIADPVNRLMRATQRVARGDLDARVLVTSSDELRRLVEAFNRMAEDLQRQRAELERTNRLAAWADMARQVAHDIKNPLTPIQLNAEHLRRVHADRGRPLGPVIDECVASILGQVRLLRQIAAEFSSFASVPRPKPAPVELAALVAEIVDPYRAGLAGRTAIDVRVSPQLPSALVDRVLIGRAISNIIENALHAMPAGGTLTLEGEQAESWIVLRVSDTGVGMDAAALSRIFEPYFSTKAIGTGLGLTIAKRNVEANGGSIAVESELGRGTAVSLRLPAVK